ncbi:hypothetical protein HBH82_251210 [Parastagonospora nodorum]|nr:hypothetical protein HBH82_251210 [Parastagonospora nodorum]KAH4749508.1 hypothetical protein HBH63_248290 [Parastagonospora nodorum]KAH4767165.1 hypothetical protein HBH62_251420 [Parastagonospora nodorum]
MTPGRWVSKRTVRGGYESGFARLVGIELHICCSVYRVDYRYIKRFLCKLFMEVVVFVGLGRCSTVSYCLSLLLARVLVAGYWRGCRVAGLSASGLMIGEKKGGRKISEIYMPQGKYLFALLLAANVLLPRELDRCNYYVEEASKPTLRAAD